MNKQLFLASIFGKTHNLQTFLNFLEEFVMAFFSTFFLLLAVDIVDKKNLIENKFGNADRALGL